MSSNEQETTLNEQETTSFVEGVDPDETITMPNPEALEEWEKIFLDPGGTSHWRVT